MATSLLPYFTCMSHCSVFKVQSFPTAFAVRFEDPIEIRSSNPAAICLVGPSGLEPPTLRLSVVRSSQLSYGPVRRHKLHIPRRTACSTSRSFRCVSSSSQTRFAGLCSDFGRLAIILFFRSPQKRMLLWDGGDSRDRTGDLLLARQALSQLSYIPKLSSLPADFIACAL